MNSLGERIKWSRKEARLTQDQLSELLGFDSGTTISNYEKNLRSPDHETLKRIAEITKSSIEWLLTGGDQKKPENEPKTDIISEPPNGYASGELQKIVELLKQLPEAVAPVQELLEAKLRQKQALKQINDI